MKRRTGRNAKQMNTLRFFLYVSLLGIGVIAGIAIRHYTKLSLGDTLDVIDLATLVVTVFLAVYIPEVLDRKLQVTRDKKELLEKRILEYQALIRRVNVLVQGDSNPSKDDLLAIRNSLDVAGYKLDSIGKLLSYARIGDTFPNEMSRIRAMNEDHRQLFADPSQKPDSAFPADVIAREAELYNKLDDATTLLIFKISDAK